MKWNGEGIVWQLALELAPAAIFGSAAALASATALSLPQFDAIPLFAGGAGFVVSWLFLHRLGARGDLLAITHFDQSQLEHELEKLAVEMQCTGCSQEDELILEDEFGPITEELLLEQSLSEVDDDSRVIRLFDPASETAGQMQARIDCHLRTTARPPLSDATQELHEALFALRQSLR